MRRGIALAGVLLALGLGQVGAQQPATSFFTGANPRDIKFQPIDVSKANRAFNMSNAFRTPSQNTGFTLSQFFPRLTLGSWPPKVAQTPILSPSPYQPNLGKK